MAGQHKLMGVLISSSYLPLFGSLKLMGVLISLSPKLVGVHISLALFAASLLDEFDGCPCLLLFALFALLVDEDLADQVWEAWDAKLISDELAASAWLLVATVVLVPDTRCEPG